MSLRCVFLGTAEFSVPSLHALVHAGHEVAAVVTQPGRPGHRGAPAPRPVAAAAESAGIPVLQPPRLREPAAVESVLALRPDVAVVAAYGQIIPMALLEPLRLGGVNVHPSLLPRWRGASPIAHAVLAGDRRTGVCIMRVEAGVDSGCVYARTEVELGPQATTVSLEAELALIGADLLVRTLADLEAGRARCQPQDEAAVTVAQRLTREHGRLQLAATTAVELDRRVRALVPWPGVTVDLAGRPVHVLAGGVEAATVEAAPGTLVGVGPTAAVVATAAGAYRLDAVQPAGGRPMQAAAYLRGRRSRVGDVVG